MSKQKIVYEDGSEYEIEKKTLDIKKLFRRGALRSGASNLGQSTNELPEVPNMRGRFSLASAKDDYIAAILGKTQQTVKFVAEEQTILVVKIIDVDFEDIEKPVITFQGFSEF